MVRRPHFAAMAQPPSASALVELLEGPAITRDVDRLPEIWRTSILTVQALAPTGLEEGPWLPNAIRGAWGHRLMARAEGVSNSEPATAFDVFFRLNARLTGRLAVPRPFVIRADVKGRWLIIQLRLFGFADAWRRDAFDAVIEALSGGLSLRPGGRQRRPAEVVAAHWSRVERAPDVPPGQSLRLHFLTPLKLVTRGGAMTQRFDNFVFSLLDRISGLARWQGIRVETDWGGWRDLAKNLDIRADEAVPASWTRRSGRLDGQPLPMSGYGNVIDIIRPPERLFPLLSLGRMIHAGGGAALGLGRFEIY